MTSPHLLTRNPGFEAPSPKPQAPSPECGLCGLPCDSSRFIRQDTRFCCAGCMNVYSILVESGLCQPGDDFRETELYQQSLRMGLISNGQVPSATSEVKGTVSPETPGQEILIHVGGMWCASCAWLIEHVVSKEPGVIKAEAFFASDLVKVKFAPQCLPPTRLIERIEQLGYHASEFTGEEGTRDEEKRDLLLRLGLSGFLWLNIMTLSTALYVGYFEIIAESIRLYLPFVLMVLATPVVFYSASPILKLGYQALRNRTLRMESLLGLGILAAYFYSAVQAFQSGIHIYFDTVCAIVTLVLI
ncbi:MAG TPA: cation transporter, partial [Acidobacteriota bacterium]|nr:cation transporter [Acidobacteriota bacterium]